MAETYHYSTIDNDTKDYPASLVSLANSVQGV